MFNITNLKKIQTSKGLESLYYDVNGRKNIVLRRSFGPDCVAPEGCWFVTPAVFDESNLYAFIDGDDTECVDDVVPTIEWLKSEGIVTEVVGYRKNIKGHKLDVAVVRANVERYNHV